MSILQPYWIAIAALLGLAGLYFPSAGGGDGWHKVIHPKVLGYLRPAGHAYRRFNLALICAAVAALALAAPSRPVQDDNVYQNSETWFVLLDVSRSMELTDIAPSRMAAARDAAARIIEMAGSRPVALVLFAGDAYLASPPSFDKAQAATFLSAAIPGVVPIEGSDAARGLSLIHTIIDDAGLARSRIFVLSDADSRVAAGEELAAGLATGGHRTDVIVFGSPASEGRSPDMDAAGRLALAGNGAVLVADNLGRVDTGALAASPPGGTGLSFLALPITTERIELLSHWVLLPLLPLLLVLYRRLT